MMIKRREFVKLIGGVSGAALFAGCGLDDLMDMPEALVEAARQGPGIETWKTTLCRLCPGGCSLRVRLVDGIPVSVKGNENYPVNEGGVCPQGLAGLQRLYNPDRTKGPLRRVGPHGGGRWESLSWDEAIDEVTAQLVALRNEGRSHEVAFLGSDESGLMADHIGRFVQAYGSPNYFRFWSDPNEMTAYRLTQGVTSMPAPDFANANYVVSLGANFLEEWHAPVYFNKLYGGHRAGLDRPRAYLVCVDSRLNLTASNADRWIPIRPGTYGALALGLAHVLIREELYDAEFVENHTFGFEDAAGEEGMAGEGFRSLVLSEFYPERVSELTGIPAETIVEIGRDLGNRKPSLVMGGNAAVDHESGTYAHMAIHSLNAMLGNLDRPGGYLRIDPPPFTSAEPVVMDETARVGIQKQSIGRDPGGRFPLADFAIESFTENVLARKPYPISLLFLYGGNPLFRTLNRHRLIEALRTIPLIVSFDPFVDETVEQADLVLPDHSFLEKWDSTHSTSAVAFSHAGLQQPVVTPFHDTRHTGDVLIALAGGVGGTVAESFTRESYEQVLRERFQGLFESGVGSLASDRLQGGWLQFLQERGWQAGRYSSFDQFWRLLQEYGGWWNPIRPEGAAEEAFSTPSGKFEFRSNRLRETLVSLAQRSASPDQAMAALLAGVGIEGEGGTAFLPRFEPPPPLDDAWPLSLVTFQTLTNRDGYSANMPMMQEMFGYLFRKSWVTWAEINPETAREFGVGDGDQISIVSEYGSFRATAVVRAGIVPGVVAVPFGQGHSTYGRYAAGHGANPNEIMRAVYDPISGMPSLASTRATILPAT